MLTVYKTRTCAYCPMVAKYLSNKGAEFREVYIDNNPEIRRELLEKTGYMSVPVTTDGTRYVVGWNVSKLLELI